MKQRIIENSGSKDDDDDQDSEEIVIKCNKVLARKREEKIEEDLEMDNISTHVLDSGNRPINLTQEMMPKEVQGNVKISVQTYEKIMSGTC
ncbi:hypothetical protein SUGI_1077130 [Cryptomeria japonica]|nr:hypothetical protein SUGI_1077130 [Cryptomeria japonica]